MFLYLDIYCHIPCLLCRVLVGEKERKMPQNFCLSGKTFPFLILLFWNVLVSPPTPHLHKTQLDRWTGHTEGPLSSVFCCFHWWPLFYEGSPECRAHKEAEIVFLPFSEFYISFFSPFFSRGAWAEGGGARDSEKQRQYFTGAAQSSSAGTQYLQPTAMQQQICACVCVCIYVCVGEQQRDKGRWGGWWCREWDKHWIKAWDGHTDIKADRQKKPAARYVCTSVSVTQTCLSAGWCRGVTFSSTFWGKKPRCRFVHRVLFLLSKSHLGAFRIVSQLENGAKFGS